MLRLINYHFLLRASLSGIPVSPPLKEDQFFFSRNIPLLPCIPSLKTYILSRPTLPGLVGGKMATHHHHILKVSSQTFKYVNHSSPDNHAL